MTKTARLFTTGGSQAIRLPKEFRFPGHTVKLRKTARGVLVLPDDNLAERRARFVRLAGSCPGLAEVPPHETPDLPRDFEP